MKRYQPWESVPTTQHVCYICQSNEAETMMGECGHTLCNKCVNMAIQRPPENCAFCRCEKVKQNKQQKTESDEGDALDKDFACHEMMLPFIMCMIIPCFLNGD